MEYSVSLLAIHKRAPTVGRVALGQGLIYMEKLLPLIAAMLAIIAISGLAVRPTSEGCNYEN
jgi:hypothetical protein